MGRQEKLLVHVIKERKSVSNLGVVLAKKEENASAVCQRIASYTSHCSRWLQRVKTKLWT